MLLVALEHDVLRLGMVPKLRVEDLLLDDLVDRELALDGREEVAPRLETTLGRRFELTEQLLHLVVVFLEQREGIHGHGLLVSQGWTVPRTVGGYSGWLARGSGLGRCKRLADGGRRPAATSSFVRPVLTLRRVSSASQSGMAAPSLLWMSSH